MAIKKRLVGVAVAAVLAVSMFPMSAFAHQEAVYVKKSVTAYKYSKDKSDKLTCLFLNDLPDVPYVNVEDYLDRIYTKDFTTKAKGSVYTISGNDITLIADTSKETVTIKNFDKGLQNNIVEVEKEDVADYLKQEKPTVKGTDKPVKLDYSKYSIDLIGDSGKLYFPLTTLSDLFDSTYRAAEYIDNKLYFLQTLSVRSDADGYFDRSSVYVQTERSQAMIDYTYNELCFFMDHFYGKPPKAQISKSIAEKGFDKTLDDYSDIKKLLKSKKRADFQLGMLLLSDAVDDGGHTIMCAGMFIDMDIYGENEKCEMLSKFQLEMMFSDEANQIIKKQMATQSKMDLVEKARKEKLKDATLVKKWDEHKTALYIKDKTAMFSFEHFEHPVVRDFAWSLDYASKKGVKNFVIDIATNGGGDESIAHFINTIITNKNKNTNEIVTQMRDAANGNLLDSNWKIDLDLNGVIDDKDKNVYYDFNYAMLTSENSFSSGNLMPCMAKDRGILVLGETSGGGTCMVSKHYYPDGTYYMTSGIYTVLRGDETNVDDGAKVDYDLTSKDSKGNKDYSNFYDFAKLEECINEFYGVKPEDTSEKDDSSKKDDSSIKGDSSKKDDSSKTDNSKKDGSSKKDDTSKADTSKPADSKAAEDTPPPTGHIGTTLTVSVLLIGAAAIAVVRRKED